MVVINFAIIMFRYILLKKIFAYISANYSIMFTALKSSLRANLEMLENIFD